MPSVGTAYVNVRVNTSGFEGSLDSLMKRLSSKMEAHGASLGKDFERGFKKTGFETLSKSLPDAVKKGVDASVKEIDKLGNKITQVAVDGHDGANMIGSGFADAALGINEATSAVRDFGKETTKAKNAGKDIDLSGLGGGGGRAGSGFRQGGDGAGFFSQKLKTLGKEADGVWPMLNKLYTLNAFGGTALAGVVGALSAVAQGLFVVASQAAAAGPALAVAASGMLALVQAGGVLKLALTGVMQAFKLGTKSQDAAAKSAGKAADNSKAIAAAQRALADAYRDAARAAEDAARKTLRAEQALAASQEKLKQAQLALNDARAEALEQLEDIGFAAEDAALAEQRAALRLQEAQADLVAVSELAPDNRARIEAELAFKEAELNYRQAKDHREDADKEQQDAAKNGIEGTDAMRDARQNEADAAAEVADNTQALADARRDEAEQAVDSANRIADAQARLADAMKSTAAGATAAATAANAFQAAMDKLGPNQQEFVNKLLDMKGRMLDFRNAIAEPMFDKLNTAFDNFLVKGKDGNDFLDTLQGSLTDTGKVLGDTAIDLSELASSDLFQGTLKSAMDQNNEAIGNFGAAGVALVNVFVQLADAAGPVLIEFSEWVKKLAEGASASTTLGNKTGDLDEKISKAADKVKQFWALGVALWDVLHTLGTAANTAADGFGAIDEKTGAARGFIPTLTDDLTKLNDKLNESGENASIIERFSTALDNMSKIGGAIWNVVDPLLEMGSDPRVGDMADKLAKTDVFDKLAETALDAGPALTDLATSIGDILTAMSESGSTKVFLETLATVAGVFGDLSKLLVGNPIGRNILLVAGSIFGVWRAAKLVTKIGVGLFKPMIDSGTAAVKGIGKVAGGLKGLITAPKGGKIAAAKAGFKGPPKDPAEEANAKKNGKSITDAFAQGIRDGLPEKDAAMMALQENVISEFTRMAPILEAEGTKVGTQVIDGLVLGLKEGVVEIGAAGEAAGREAAAAIAKGAQTASPSRLTLKTGDDIMEGLELGIKEGSVEAMLAAEAAGAKVAGAVGTGAKGATGGVAAAGAGAAAAAGGIDDVIPPGGAAKGGKFAGLMGKMGKAMGPVSKLAKPLAGGMKLIGGAFSLMLGPVGMIAMTLIPILWPLIEKLNEKFHIMDKVMAGVSWVLDKLSAAFTWLWDNAIKPLWDFLVENGGKVWDQITEAIEPLKEGLQTFWDLIQDAFNWIKDHWKLILGILTGPLGLAILAITENWDKIKEIISKAIDFITGLFSGMWDGIKAAWDTIWGWFSTLWENIIKPELTDIIDGWKRIFSGIWDGIKTAWDTIVGWLTTLWENVIKPIIQTYIDGWKLIFSTVWDGIKTAWDTVVGWLTGLWENTIKPIIDQMVKNFKNNLKAVWNGLKEGWTIISTWVSNFWRDKLKPKIQYIVDKGKALLKGLWQGIKDGWTAVGTWISGLWSNTIKPKLKTLRDNMVDYLKGVWNGLGSGLITALNWVADKVNWMIGKINSVLDKFGSSGITWTWPHLEWNGFAQGGPVRGRGSGTSDSIPARLSNGEYVIPAKASKKLGPEALEYMRKYGKLPPQGGFGWDTLTAPFKKIGEVIGQGAKIALQWVLSQVDDRLGPSSSDNFVTKILRAGLHWGADKIVGWGSNKDSAASGVTATGPAESGVMRRGNNALWGWPAANKAPMTRGPGGHGRAWAVDFAVPTGTTLLAVSSGVVKHAGMGTSYNSTYGNYVQILGHPTGQKSLYAHMSQVSVRAGQRVVRGQILGRSGNTGHSTGPHLHFELNPAMHGTVIEDMKRKGIYIGLAQGGVVSPDGGGIMAMIGEAGKSERVTPLDRDGFTPAERKIIATLESKLGGGGGGDTYQIHPSEKMNEAALADLVARRVAWKRRRGASR